MSGAPYDPIAAAKKRLAEEERLRRERDSFLASPAGQHGKDFGTRLGPWILELAGSLARDWKVAVSAMHVRKRSIRDDDAHEWPCGRGQFEASLHRFPGGAVIPDFKSTPYLVGCRCPPADSWAMTFGPPSEQNGILSYGILPESQQFWFTPAPLGDPAEASHYFDGSAGYDQIAPGEMVVQVSGVRDTSDQPSNPPHPCSLGTFSLEHSTNFFLPLRSAEIAFRATLEAFLRGDPLAPQWNRHQK
jgi:hypothetical protein